jgi:hypothetical protein
VTEVSPHIPLSQDAALVVALAGTAIPFSHSAEDEAERWLRALRLHGQVGVNLQALGVGETPLTTSPEHNHVSAPGTPPFGRDVVDRVAIRAAQLAEARDADAVSTVDLLFSVLDVYGHLFERALYLRGTSRDELVERMSESSRPGA